MIISSTVLKIIENIRKHFDLKFKSVALESNLLVFFKKGQDFLYF